VGNDVDGGNDEGIGINEGNDGSNVMILEGPDLNASRSPLDRKEYRQIMLPNGLRVVLVSDVVAMTQGYNVNGSGNNAYDLHGDVGEEEDDDDDDDEDEEDGGGGGGTPHRRDRKKTNKDRDVEDGEKDGDADHSDDDDDDGSDSDEEEEDAEEAGGLRNAAAAMVVGVGAMYDPPECQGMAHFLEHLLFMGSKKYPEENAYDSFMSKHGGDDNAYTEMEHTVYHFDIPQEHLGKALDLFAQFFIHPLMLESSVERELQAVESEFQLVKNADSTRVQQLMCHTAGRTHADHPGLNSWDMLPCVRGGSGMG
jgi:nardilysin